MWDGARRSALDVAALLRRLKIRCHLSPADSVTVALSAEEAKALGREYRARKDAGLEAGWPPPARLRERMRLDVAGGIRTDGNATFDPYRACLGVAASAASHGAQNL